MRRRAGIRSIIRSMLRSAFRDFGQIDLMYAVQKAAMAYGGDCLPMDRRGQDLPLREYGNIAEFMRVCLRRHAMTAFRGNHRQDRSSTPRAMVADKPASCGPGRPGRRAAWLPITRLSIWAARWGLRWCSPPIPPSTVGSDLFRMSNQPCGRLDRSFSVDQFLK